MEEKNALIIDKVIIGKKTSGWISEYIDFFFEKRLPNEVTKNPSEMKQYFECNPNERLVFLREFKYNFSELYELFCKIYDIMS